MTCLAMSIIYIDLIADNKIITIFDINSFLPIFEIHNINDSISPWEFEYIYVYCNFFEVCIGVPGKSIFSQNIFFIY